MRTTSRIVAVAALLLLMTGAAALAQRNPDARLLHAVEIGPDGVKAANLQCASSATSATSGDRSGVVLRNGSPNPVMLSFSDGSRLLLEPGQDVTLSEEVASSHKCACQCTCSGTGFSETITFDCPSGGCAGENGSACLVLVGSPPTAKEGTLSGCKKIYIPILSSAGEVVLEAN
jgi:hypothetical protein